MSRGQSGEPAGVGRAIKPVAVSVLAGIVITAVILLLMSVVVAARGVPGSVIEPMALFALGAGAFVSGYLCARAIGANGLACGVVCGCVLTVIVLASGMISGGGGLGVPALFRAVFVLLPAMIGGVVSVNTRRRR